MQVSRLFLYPIKGCRGIALRAGEVERRGLAGDRRWMVVDDTGRFVSQREHPRLALVDVAWGPGADSLALAAPDQPPCTLPRVWNDGPFREVEIWRNRVPARVHPGGSAWFSRVLGFPASAVYMPDEIERAVNPARSRPGDIVSFADAYPLLVISEASLHELNARLAAPISMRRFRPNLVVAGASPFAEDTWTQIRIGGVVLRWAKPCDRCTVTTVDPDTGTRGKEPLATLASFRRRDGAVWFGSNFIPDRFGPLQVGDPVEILGTQPAFIDLDSC